MKYSKCKLVDRKGITRYWCIFCNRYVADSSKHKHPKIK
jgi:hypothetical protein